MNRYTYRSVALRSSMIILLSLLGGLGGTLYAQVDDIDLQLRARQKKKVYDDSDSDRHGTLNAFKLTPRIGDLEPAFVDTLKLNYFHRAWVDGRSIAGSFVGTYMSPYQSKVYFDRPLSEWGDYFFTTPFSYLIQRGDDMRWFDTKVPYSLLSYVKTGRSEEVEEEFHALFSLNKGKRFNIGAQFDYDYANGVYSWNKGKNITYRVFASYIGDRYEAYISGGNTNVVNQENGGLVDDRYITNPDDFTDGRRAIRPKDIPTKFQSTWNRVVYGSVRLNHRYSLGIYKSDSIKKFDTIRVVRHFVPVTSFFHNVLYEHGRRHFISQDPKMATLYPDPIIPRPDDARFYPDDRLSLVKVSNTLGIELLEGFHKWAKMGVAAYISYDYKNYKVPILGAIDDNLDKIEHTTYIGGRLSSDSFKYLQYYVSGELGVLGSQIGEVRVDGRLQTHVSIKNNPIRLKLTGHLRNTPAPYLLNRYKSTLHEWNNDMKMTQALRIGGELDADIIGSRIYANIETVQNPIYINRQAEPTQSQDNLRVLSVGLDQSLHFYMLHWDNSIVWQNTSSQTITPLPTIAVYSNLYLQSTIANVMTLQLGVNAKWHTAYHVPYYDPTTQLFAPQEEITLGGKSPFMNGYASAHLKRTRFFINYYNLSALIFKPNYFTMPHYPLYPPRIQVGIVVDLRN